MLVIFVYIMVNNRDLFLNKVDSDNEGKILFLDLIDDVLEV